MNVDRKITEIALIIFALVFVILMSIMFGHVVGFGNNTNEQLSNMNRAVIEADLMNYDDTVISGDTVISTINKMKELKDGTKMSYTVKTTSWTDYGHQAVAGAGSIDSIDAGNVGTAEVEYKKYSAEVGDSDFISPVDSYKSKVVANENGVIIGIAFEKI